MDITSVKISGNSYNLPGGGKGDYIVNQYTETVEGVDWLIRVYKSNICEIYGMFTTQGTTDFSFPSKKYPVTFTKIYYKNADAQYVSGPNAITGLYTGTGSAADSLTETGKMSQNRTTTTSGTQVARVWLHVIGTI